ncbi:MAG TPA: hypothetical protein VJ730_06590 [Nitrososphaera sp.]|nr:hypothetical protein [Nitrososphaera sp.]
MDSCDGNRLVAAKRMSEISKREVTVCWQLIEQVKPLTDVERERYRLLGIG